MIKKYKENDHKTVVFIFCLFDSANIYICNTHYYNDYRNLKYIQNREDKQGLDFNQTNVPLQITLYKKFYFSIFTCAFSYF